MVHICSASDYTLCVCGCMYAKYGSTVSRRYNGPNIQQMTCCFSPLSFCQKRVGGSVCRQHDWSDTCCINKLVIQSCLKKKYWKQRKQNQFELTDYQTNLSKITRNKKLPLSFKWVSLPWLNQIFLTSTSISTKTTDSQPESKRSLVIVCAVICTDVFACWASSVKMCPL